MIRSERGPNLLRDSRGEQVRRRCQPPDAVEECVEREIHRRVAQLLRPRDTKSAKRPLAKEKMVETSDSEERATKTKIRDPVPREAQKKPRQRRKRVQEEDLGGRSDGKSGGAGPLVLVPSRPLPQTEPKRRVLRETQRGKRTILQGERRIGRGNLGRGPRRRNWKELEGLSKGMEGAHI